MAGWPSSVLLALLAAGLVLCLVFLYQLLRRLAELQGEGRQLLLLQQQLESLRGQFHESLERNLGLVNRSLDERLRVVGEVHSRLGALEEASRRIMEIGRDMAGLQEILRAPKLRGGLGELLLENLLGQMLPREHYRLQHAFAGGDRVDVALCLGGRLLCVDAKFPLENFRRLSAAREEERRAARKLFLADVRRHIDSVASKYILPGEGTFDFAMMYIPVEGVYYEIVVRDEEGGSILEQALARRVIPVSPGTFYAYLQLIILGLRGLHVEERAREIMARLGGLKLETERLRGDFRKLGGHLRNAAASYEAADRRLERMDLHIERLGSPEELGPGLPAEGGAPGGEVTPGEGSGL